MGVGGCHPVGPRVRPELDQGSGQRGVKEHAKNNKRL